ncbi:MAG: hypothetical protein KA807_17220 [Prolixibacteraceae bacterium]|nr:hypothetical protein [Prolixibacteraceae bacterium]
MNSRKRSKQWPFPRHKQYSAEIRVAAAKWFKEKKFAPHPRMPYCLKEWVNWKDNIILPDVAEYIEKQSTEAQTKKKPFPLHKWLHHGMSSQAMAFNLIGPLIIRRDYAPLSDVLKSKDIPGANDIVEACFEYEDRDVFNEDTGQPTSVDIVLKNSNGEPHIFIESKLDEQEFGGCSVFSAGDCSGKNPIGSENDCFLHFIGRTYWNLMAKHGITESVRNDRQCLFVAHYQFFREVIFAIEKGGIFVLLSDERSPVFQCQSGEKMNGLLPFLSELLPDNLRDKVAPISIQEFVNAIEQYRTHHDWIYEFKKKYGMV